MRVAIITTHPIQYNAPFFEELSKRGNIEFKVFYSWGESVLKNKFDVGFGKVVEWDIPLLKGYDYEFLENIAEEKGSHHFSGIDNPHIITTLKNYQPNAIIVFGWAFKSHFKAMRYFKGKVPVFMRGDSTLFVNAGFVKRTTRKIVLNFVYRYVDYALYVGKNSYDYFKYVGLKDQQLFHAPHVVDNCRFRLSSPERDKQVRNYKNMLNIQDDDLVFLFAGKFEDYKNPLLLIQAFEALHFDNKSHLVLVGNGRLESAMKSYPNLKNIHFLDFQNQTSMPAVYAMCDVFVLPSHSASQSETWGLALNEAMATGKALLASDQCGGAVDLIQPGVNGYIFKSNDLADLKRKLLLLQSRKEEIKTMGEQSLKIIENFSIKKLCDKVEEALFKVLTKGNYLD